MPSSIGSLFSLEEITVNWRGSKEDKEIIKFKMSGRTETSTKKIIQYSQKLS